MARLHSKNKGRSGSTKPLNPDMSFVKLKPAEIEKIIVDLATQDITQSKIGLILRDRYGVPNVKLLCEKSIGQIVRENSISKSLPEDLQALFSKYLNLKKHLGNNTRDTHNRRSLILIESKIRRISKYYKNKGILDKKWSYNKN